MDDPVRNDDREDDPTPSDLVDRPPAAAVRPIAGFWRRLAAFLIDGLLLFVVGQCFALALGPTAVHFGPYGRLVGQPIVLLYFGVMDSRLCGGQTLGKRLLRIGVADRDTRPIALWRSALRTLIWLVPWTLNGWALPLLATPVVSGVVTVIVFGVGGALLFTMAFNRRTRQGFHDMLCGSYVVRRAAEPELLPVTPRSHWIASAAVVVVAALIPTAMGVLGPGTPPNMASLVLASQVLGDDPRFFSAGVTELTLRDFGGPARRALIVRVWHKGWPSEEQSHKAALDAARVALVVLERPEQYELMRVSVTCGYDLGIAAGFMTRHDGQPVAVWRERLGMGLR